MRESEVIVYENKMSNGEMFYVLLFDGRIKFAILKSSLMDYLFQIGIYDKEGSNHIEEGKWTSMKKKAISTIRLAVAPKIKYHYLKETESR